MTLNQAEGYRRTVITELRTKLYEVREEISEVKADIRDADCHCERKAYRKDLRMLRLERDDIQAEIELMKCGAH